MSSRRRKRSDGVYHARLTLALTPLALGLGWAVFGFQAGVACGLGCLTGVALSPDLDQIGPTYSELVWRRFPLIGWVLSWLWLALWLPYGMFMRHRGASHTPVLGTLVRLLYLACFVVPLWMWQELPAPTLEQVRLFFFAVAGLMLSDFGHWGRDRFGWEV